MSKVNISKIIEGVATYSENLIGISENCKFRFTGVRISLEPV